MFIGIDGGRISRVAAWDDAPEGGWQAKRTLHAANQVVMPGLVNGHTHLPMTLFRGLADDLPFAQWLYDTILPLERDMVDEQFIRAGTELAALESIRCGVTTACDMYFFEDVIADVWDKAGLRGVLGEAVTDFPTPDRGETGENYRILDRMIEKYRDHDRIVPAIAPHAPYSCSDATLRKVVQYAEKKSLPILIHVSETEHEVQESLKQYSKTPVARLHDLGLMNGRAVFAHCVHVTEADMELMAKSRTSAVYNPESNMKLGAGVAPVPRLLQCGICVGLGTDGAASNNDLNVFREMDSAAKIQKLVHHDNTAMTALQSLRLATLGGAEALGLGSRIGSVEEGKLADIVFLDLKHPHMQPVHDVASQLVYAATGLEVSTVICHGKILLEDGEFTTLDADRIYREASSYQRKILSRLSAP